MAVNGVSGINLVSPSPVSFDKQQDNTNTTVSFADYLKDALNNTSDLITQSENLNEDFAAGKTDNIHDVMVASEKADIALQFTMQIRNKILDAYNEIMRIQI